MIDLLTEKKNQCLLVQLKLLLQRLFLTYD